MLVLSLLTRFCKKRKVIFAMSLNKSDGLSTAKSLIEAGYLKTIIDRQYSMEELPFAHEYVEEGHKKGNVVIVV
ncbi:MAG: zinc-binding dehydrogenase [Bacteroidales bacterium]|nr:zinc-binding dehydrogenase [Bacteroidales bacterium]